MTSLFHLFVRDYVQPWYGQLSTDDELIKELHKTIIQSLHEIGSRMENVNWVALLCREIPSALQQHIHDYRLCREKIGTSYAGDVDFESLFHGCQPHSALKSPEAEADYLRRTSEAILTALLPADELKSDVLKFLLREMSTAATMANFVDVLADPNVLYKMIIMVSGRAQHNLVTP
jgi:hypothetical protein